MPLSRPVLPFALDVPFEAPVVHAAPALDSPTSPPPPPPLKILLTIVSVMFPGPVGGSLNLFVSAWKKITKDSFILSVVAHSFWISVSPDFPLVLRKPTQTLRDPSAHLQVLEEIMCLVQKKAIVQVTDRPDLSLSPVFVIPKHTGGLHVILHLKTMILFIPPHCFQMETLTSIFPTLSAQDWAISVDLKDRYLHVPIHPSSQHHLGFHYQDWTFVYQVLPFGLKDSPWVFTCLVANLVAYLRLCGIHIHYYLDDWLIVAPSRSRLLAHLQETLTFAQSLGFLINWKKSSLLPSQVPIF